VLKDAVAAGGVPSVASSTLGGQIANVTAVSCGAIIDTQRRRRNHVTVYRTPKYAIG
jgi:hypothetical protein